MDFQDEDKRSAEASGPVGVEESPAHAQSVMLLVVTDDGRLLLHLRDDIPGILHPGCWAGFGGRAEGNESIEEALRREVLEETGIELIGASSPGERVRPRGRR